jgi:hypothetical protein
MSPPGDDLGSGPARLLAGCLQQVLPPGLDLPIDVLPTVLKALRLAKPQG